jgi:hypothetical protein
MIERIPRKRKTESQSKAVASAQAPRCRLFGQPQVLGGEDRAAYDELLARICVAVKPVDTIEEMFTADIVSLHWEVLRWRRLKSSLILARGLKAVEEFLSNELDYNLYSEDFADDLAEILEDNLSEGQAKDAQRLARACARNERDAVDKVNEVLAGIKLNTYGILKDARTREAKELVRDYVQRAPGAVKLLNELLTDAGLSIDAFMADALAEKLDYIERIDRLAAIAESRRNASLSEIERRRAAFGAKLRQNVQEIEDADFKVIELRQRQQRE